MKGVRSSAVLLLLSMPQQNIARFSPNVAFSNWFGRPIDSSFQNGLLFHSMRPNKCKSQIMVRQFSRTPILRLKGSVSPEELTPGSDQMKARAKVAIGKMGKQFVTPLEAANILAGERNELLTGTMDSSDDALLYDVRTPQQRREHEIMPGVKGLTAMGAESVPLDDMIKMKAEELQKLLGITEQGQRRNVVLTCTAGPKSCVAWDYLTQNVPGVNPNNLFVIDGGIKNWAALGFPTDPVDLS